MCGRGIEPELDKMLGSHTSWILQAQRSEIRFCPCHEISLLATPIKKFQCPPKRCAKAGNCEIFGIYFMKKILEYIKSVRSEWFKIVWPSRDAVIRATIMILIFSGAAALFFFVVDSILNALVGWIF